MALSIFDNKEAIPGPKDLKSVLGNCFELWEEVKVYVYSQYPAAVEKWTFPGKKYGWSYSLKDKKRAIIYLTPSEGYFMVGLVFGQKATEYALASDISPNIKEIISSARVYAEGRGFRIDIRNNKRIKDVKRLIDMKLAN